MAELIPFVQVGPSGRLTDVARERHIKGCKSPARFERRFLGLARELILLAPMARESFRFRYDVFYPILTAAREMLNYVENLDGRSCDRWLNGQQALAHCCPEDSIHA